MHPNFEHYFINRPAIPHNPISPSSSPINPLSKSLKMITDNQSEPTLVQRGNTKLKQQPKQDLDRKLPPPRKNKRPVKFWVASCRYPVVKEAATKVGWKLIDSEQSKESCNVLWVDTSNILDHFVTIKPWQRINHFPGIINIARKTKLAENLQKMKEKFGTDYNFFPTTYILPRDLPSMRESDLFTASGKSKCTFIVKPDGGCQGRGIFLTRSLSALEDLKSTHVAQRYIPNPLLIDGKKFDLRVYVLITSCAPLRIYIFRDGLVRLCTQDFVTPSKSNLDNQFIHLTNYSINKQSDDFQDGESDDDSGKSGTKRSIKWLLSHLSSERGEEVVRKMWEEIGQIVNKTLLSITPILEREYSSIFGPNSSTDCDIASKDSVIDEAGLNSRANQTNESKESKRRGKRVAGSRCFTILGFDVLLSTDLKPHLIEVNHLPSFTAGSKLDQTIKSSVCQQTFANVNRTCAHSDKRIYEASEKLRRMNRLHNASNSMKSNFVGALDINANCDAENKCSLDIDGTSSVCNNVKKLATEIYTSYAPDKLEKIDVLFEKYKGHETWLVGRLKEKYIPGLANEGPVSKKEEAQTKSIHPRNLNHEDLNAEFKILVEMGDFDRIYPSKCSDKMAIYGAMQQHAANCAVKEQQRLTCPLWQQRVQDCNTLQEKGYPTQQSRTSKVQKDARNNHRANWLVQGNIHTRIRDEGLSAKSKQQLSFKQAEAFDRLAKGYSTKQLEKGSFITKLTEAEEIGQVLRKRKEKGSTLKTQLDMRKISIEFTHLNKP